MYKYLILSIACWSLSLPNSVAATADELAREIIQDESPLVIYANETQEEVQRIAAANSRLRWLMLNDSSVSEEIRICFALRIIGDGLRHARIGRRGIERTPREEALLKKRLLLGQRLIEIDQTKAEQGGAGEPATRSESDLEGGEKPQPELKGRSR